MYRAILMLVVAPGLAACAVPKRAAETATGAYPSQRVDQAAADLLARTYTFGAAETPLAGCLVTLRSGPFVSSPRGAMGVLTMNSQCRRMFASLRAVTRWSPTGGASVALFGGNPLRELADLSPVQDGSGVYLRGGFAGDDRVYELRAPGE